MLAGRNTASSSEAVGRQKAETFRFTIALAAPESELQAWFDQAQAGESVTYASGFALPREAAGVKLVQAWAREGFVHLKQARDRDYPRRWLFLAERASLGIARPRPAAQRGDEVTRIQLRKLLETIRRVADRGEVLPPYRRLASDLCGTPARGPQARRGADRISYLLRRLETEGRIRLIPAPAGAQHGPQVTVLAKGRGCGKTTAQGASKGGR